MLVFIFSILINFIFNYHRFWRELFFDRLTVGAVYGEIQAYEWVLETFYKNLISGKNAFGLQPGILHPFETDFSPIDMGNGLFFPLLRPFLSTHQSLAVITSLSLFMAGIGMYLLLKRLNLGKLVSFLISLPYAYMTFLTPRIGGHLNYTCHYVFPWFFYCFISLIENHKPKNKILPIMGTAFFFCLSLWLNKYYFIILIISLMVLIIYLLLKRRQLLWQKIKFNWLYLSLTLAFTIILLIPWLKAFYQASLFSEPPVTNGWGGAIQFSSDLLGFFIPSFYNPVYGSLVGRLTKNIEFSHGIFENFSYPGIIILLSYACLIIFYKKVNKKFKKIIRPYLVTSLFFFILTLGPFLHIAGRWVVKIEEGINLVFPLPYALLHYLPFLGNIRSPGRLVVGAIFFSYIICAYLITIFLKNKSTCFKTIFSVLFLTIFIIDHRYPDNYKPQPQHFPYKIYQQIKNDPETISVLEIPFTVRDGFTYFGSYNPLMTIGQLTYDKPMLGGYLGRIPNYTKQYYTDDLFLGYIGRLIDQGKEQNSTVNQDELANWQEINLEESLKTIDFLDIKYIVLNEDSYQTDVIASILAKLNYQKELADGNFSLWKTNLAHKEFLDIDMNSLGSPRFLGLGWHLLENDLRFTDQKSSVMFKITKPRLFALNFEARAFHQDQIIKIYLNKELITKVNISTAMSDYSIPIDSEFKKGINTIHFISNNKFRPAKVIPDSLDKRELSLQFSNISLE